MTTRETPVTTTITIEVEVEISAYIQHGDTPEDDEIVDLIVERVSYNGKDFIDITFNNHNEILKALGDSINEPLFSAASE